MRGDPDMAKLVRAKIAACHRFFEEWFTGRCGNDALASAMSVFAPDFYRVAPDGSLQTRAQLYAALEGAEGSKPATFTIEIDFEDVRVFASGPVAVRYVERQSGGGGRSARRATALFATANGSAALQWQNVHETWINNTGVWRAGSGQSKGDGS